MHFQVLFITLGSTPQPSPLPLSEMKQMDCGDFVDDPGLFWSVDSVAIHAAHGMAGAPITQGANATISVTDLKNGNTLYTNPIK